MKSLIIIFSLFIANHLIAAPEVVRSDKYNFIWPLPPTWNSVTPLSNSQFAAKSREGSLMTCAIMVKSAGSTTLEYLLEKQRADPQFFFKGAKARFPAAKFHSSAITKLGSQDAIMTGCYYTMSNLDISMTAFLFQIVTINNGLVYVVSFECLPDDIESGRMEMRKVLAAFSFTK